MDTYQNPSDLYVDYFSALQKFTTVIVRALPEMKVRAKSAAWVLCNRQMRSRETRSPFTLSRRLNLEDAQLRPSQQLDINDRALFELQRLNKYLIEYRVMPAIKVPRIIQIMDRYPVVNVRQMAENAGVSEDTAKRWLKAMERSCLVQEKYVNGQNQYLCTDLLKIIDLHRP